MSQPDGLLSPRFKVAKVDEHGNPNVAKDIFNKVKIFEGVKAGPPRHIPKRKAPQMSYVDAFDTFKPLLLGDDSKVDEKTKETLKQQFSTTERDFSNELEHVKVTVSQKLLGATVDELKTEKQRLQELIEELKVREAQLKEQYEARQQAQGEQIESISLELAETVAAQDSLEKELESTKQKLASVNTQLEQTEMQIATISQAAPKGEVTLVFTDVQGSTTQWEMHPDIMNTALRMHNVLMRNKIKEYAGYEVKTEGDAFMIAFESPLDAVRWCLDVQTALLDEDWPEELFEHPDSAIEEHPDDKNDVLYRGLRVRMGVHCGEPRAERDPVTTRMDYFGPMVNRSARVEGATHGGQVLVSGPVVEALGTDMLALLGQPAFRCLGEFQLKGLDTPETLYELLPQRVAKRTFKAPPVPPIPVAPPSPENAAFVSIDVENADELFELYPLAMMPAVKQYKALIESVRMTHRGYVARQQMDAHIVVFDNALAAVLFARDLHTSLMNIQWDEKLADHQSAAVVEHVFNGLRARVAIVYGSAELSNDGDSVEYSGPIFALLTQLHQSTLGGHTLVTNTVWTSKVMKKAEMIEAREVGKLNDDETVFELLPHSLKQRQEILGKIKLKKLTEEETKPPKGNVAIAVAMISGASSLWENQPDDMRKSIRVWERVINECSAAHGGYVASSKGSRFVVAFGDVLTAVKWATKMQKLLLEAPWPEHLTKLQKASIRSQTMSAAATVENEDSFLFRGLRASICIEYGPVNTTYAGPVGQKLTYIGPIATDALDGAKAAAGGQILIGPEAWLSVRGLVEYRGYDVYDGLLSRSIMTSKKPVQDVLDGVVAFDVGRIRLREALLSARVYKHVLNTDLIDRVRHFPERAVVAPTGDVTIVFCGIDNYTDILAKIADVAQDVQDIFSDVIHEASRAYDGYEARNTGDSVMMAFDAPLQAMLWCAEVQTQLLEQPWPEALLALDETKPVKDSKGNLLFNGLRVSMALHSGQPRYEAHPMTNRLDFFGDVTSATATIEALAHPGQILVTEAAWAGLEGSDRKGRWTVTPVPHKFHFVGIEKHSQLRQVLPVQLSGRNFDPLTDAKRPKITGDVLRAKTTTLNVQNKVLNKKLGKIETEIEETSAKVNSLKSALKDVQRGDADPQKLLEMAFDEVGFVEKQQKKISMTVTEVNKNSKQMGRQVTKLERMLQKLENTSHEEKSSLQANIDTLRSQLAEMAKLQKTDEQLRFELAENAAKLAKINQQLKTTKSLHKKKLAENQALRAKESAEVTTRVKALSKTLDEVNAGSTSSLRTLEDYLKASCKAIEDDGVSSSKQLTAMIKLLLQQNESYEEEETQAQKTESASASKIDKLKSIEKNDSKLSSKYGELSHETLIAVNQLAIAEQQLQLAEAARVKASADAHRAMIELLNTAHTQAKALRNSRPDKPTRRLSQDWVDAMKNLEREGPQVSSRYGELEVPGSAKRGHKREAGNRHKSKDGASGGSMVRPANSPSHVSPPPSDERKERRTSTLRKKRSKNQSHHSNNAK